LFASILCSTALVLGQVVMDFYAANKLIAPIMSWTSYVQACFREVVKRNFGM